MGFMDYEKAQKVYVVEPMMESVKRLIDFDVFHCLLSGGVNAALKVQEKYGRVPVQLLEWLKLCDGGLLFDTVMLSTKEFDKELGLEFDTYDELNSRGVVEGYNLPKGYVIFAMRSYGDPICFSIKEDDDRIYLWNCEENRFDDIWDSFEDWLAEEIDDAIRLIADNVLQPLSIKLGGEGNE